MLAYVRYFVIPVEEILYKINKFVQIALDFTSSVL